MGKSDPQFLRRLEEQSRKKQETFMANISERLGRKRPEQAPEHSFRGAPDFWKRHSLGVEERIALFMENWTKAGGHARRFDNASAVRAFIAETGKELKAKHWICHDHPFLTEWNPAEEMDGAEMTVWDPSDPDDMKRRAAGADIGVIVADYAVSATGSVVTMSASGKGRTVSLLPTVLMAVIPASVVKTRLGEVMEQIRGIGFNAMPAGIHFISGPSRSADIENDLTIGVHGPGVVYALVVDGM